MLDVGCWALVMMMNVHVRCWGVLVLVSSFTGRKNRAIVNFLVGLLFKRGCGGGPGDSRELVFWPLFIRGGLAQLLTFACPGLWFQREWVSGT